MSRHLFILVDKKRLIISLIEGCKNMGKSIVSFSKFVQKRKCGSMCMVLEKIRNKTPYELLEEYNIPLTPPIDIATLLERIGISSIAKDFSQIEDIAEVERGSILGAAFSSGEDLAIFYKSSDTYHRKKFTIAHELAHCCLHCPENVSDHVQYRLQPYFQLSKEELQREKEANIFAGHLLIPADVLLEYYNKMVIPSLTELAKIFDVSTSVMAARLDYLEMAYYKDSVTESII